MNFAERVRAALAGRYELEHEVGRGGMAVVYLARDVRHERQVAVKVLRPELAASLATDRFLREIHIAAELQHPLIVPLYESGGGPDGLLWYVMPYIEGETLRARLLREQQLPLDDALQIACDAAEALTWAHAHGIVHRDIKPENILLSGGHALVADFGLARALTQAAGGFTSSGLVVGTPQYMSPEQGSGSTTVDGRSDIYSLACVLYEMLAGEPPFTGPTPQAVIARHVSERPPSLRVVRPAAPESVEAALRVALAKTPADRFATAQQFVAALHAPRRAVPGSWRRAAWLVPAVLAVALGWLGWRASHRLRLDPNRYLVASFAPGPGTAPPLLDADQCQWRLSAALRSWDSISVVDNLQVRDALARRSVAAPTQHDWVTVARGLGAGRLVRGEVARVGDTTFLTASVFNVASGSRPLQQVTEALSEQSGDLARQFAHLAAALLGLPPPAASVWSTRSLAAGRAFVAGDNALAVGRLKEAADSFRAATRLDPQFADAYFWFAEVQLWRGRPVDMWADAAQRALDLRVRVADPRGRRLVGALSALAQEDYPKACTRFREALTQDPVDFAAWIGLGECQFRDRVVVRDRASPSGVQFRSSYASAVRAYRRALDLAPWLTGASLPRLMELLFVEPDQVRSGHALSPDTETFWAHPGLANDTLAFVPFPAAEVRAGRPWTQSPTMTQALRRDRETLRELAENWAAAYPDAPAALNAVAEAAERDARLSHDGTVLAATVDRISGTTVRAGDSIGAMNLAHTRIRLLVKLDRLSEARSQADSLLQSHPNPDPTMAQPLASLALLVGRVYLGARVAALGARALASGTGSPFGQLPIPLLEGRERLRAYAAVGEPLDSIRALTARVDSAVSVSVPRSAVAEVRYRLLGDPGALAFPVAGSGPVHGQRGANDVLRMQDELAHGDSAAVRARLDTVQAIRAAIPPQDVAVDRTFEEAWLLLQLGDSISAERRLVLALTPPLGLSLPVLSDVAQAGALVRSMTLLAELADRLGDRATAQRWATAVVNLWHDADPEFAPVVQRMRAIARQTGR